MERLEGVRAASSRRARPACTPTPAECIGPAASSSRAARDAVTSRPSTSCMAIASGSSLGETREQVRQHAVAVEHRRPPSAVRRHVRPDVSDRSRRVASVRGRLRGPARRPRGRGDPRSTRWSPTSMQTAWAHADTGDGLGRARHDRPPRRVRGARRRPRSPTPAAFAAAPRRAGRGHRGDSEAALTERGRAMSGAGGARVVAARARGRLVGLPADPRVRPSGSRGSPARCRRCRSPRATHGDLGPRAGRGRRYSSITDGADGPAAARGRARRTDPRASRSRCEDCPSRRATCAWSSTHPTARMWVWGTSSTDRHRTRPGPRLLPRGHATPPPPRHALEVDGRGGAGLDRRSPRRSRRSPTEQRPPTSI